LFYAKLYRHDHPEEWYASVTREFLRQTAREGVAEATLAHTYASVRHFARWIHFKVQAFPLGCPTDGVRPPREPEPQCATRQAETLTISKRPPDSKSPISSRSAVVRASHL